MNEKFIKLVSVCDYHDFEIICTAFKDFELDWEECGYCEKEQGYVGIVYDATLGSLPPQMTSIVTGKQKLAL